MPNTNDICTQLWDANNKDFKDYVEKYIFKHRITIDEALRHSMVREYANYILSRGDNHHDNNYARRETEYGEDRSC